MVVGALDKCRSAFVANVCRVRAQGLADMGSNLGGA